jgi:hypothetical protein
VDEREPKETVTTPDAVEHRLIVVLRVAVLVELIQPVPVLETLGLPV